MLGYPSNRAFFILKTAEGYTTPIFLHVEQRNSPRRTVESLGVGLL